MTTLSI